MKIRGEMKMYFMLRLISPLIILLSLISLLFAAEKKHNEVVAKIGGDDIYMFEIENFVNKVIPMENVHSKSLGKKKYWDVALKESINSRLLVLYIKKHNKELYNGLEKKARENIQNLKKKFKNTDEFNDALINTGITDQSLLKIYLDLNVVEHLKGEFYKIGVSEKEMKDYYAKNESMFKTGESVIVENCLIAADERDLNKKGMDEKLKIANNVVSLYQSKQFEQARKFCADKPYPKEDRVYSYSKNYNVDSILKLKKGQVGGPYKNIYGYLVVYVKDRKGDELLKYSDVKDEIKEIMLKKRFGEYLNKLLEVSKNENPVKVINSNID